VADIDGNGKLDVLFSCLTMEPSMQTDYYIGWDIEIDGSVSGWSDEVIVASAMISDSGAGAAIGDLNGDHFLDLLLLQTF